MNHTLPTSQLVDHASGKSTNDALDDKHILANLHLESAHSFTQSIQTVNRSDSNAKTFVVCLIRDEYLLFCFRVKL